MERILGSDTPGYLISSMTPRRRALRYASLVVLPLIAVYLFHERLITNHDPGNFLAAIELGLNAIEERPHVPGYPLFVLLWQSLTAIGLSPQNAIFVSNAFWYSIGLVALYKLALRFTTENAAYFAALFAALNPLVLFYASTGETYIYDLAFSSLTMLALLSVKPEHTKWVWLAIGVMGGFRLSSVIFMYPVMITLPILWKSTIRQIAVLHLALVVGSLLWLIPFTIHHGGWNELMIMLQATIELKSTVLQSASGFVSAALWMVNLALPLFFLVPKLFKRWSREAHIILLVWIVVPGLFFLFRFYAKGYIIIILPAIAILLASTLGMLQNWKQQLAVTAMRVGGLCMFLLIPFVPPSLELEASNNVGDRIKTAGLRSISWFAPSFDHLAVRTKSMLEAKVFIESNSLPGDTIVINRSTGMWAHPRSLQYHLKDRHIVLSTGNGYGTDFYRTKKINLIKLSNLIPDRNTLFLCDRQMIDEMPAIDRFKAVERGEYVVLYRAPGSELNSLIRSLE